jgi:hypothetical protein
MKAAFFAQKLRQQPSSSADRERTAKCACPAVIERVKFLISSCKTRDRRSAQLQQSREHFLITTQVPPLCVSVQH